ncbi:hypothetical protein K7G98_34130, partial [Saccharothrix sp. MB29]|nr:hypothetical protein [Saccharothrix sp. MB29]
VRAGRAEVRPGPGRADTTFVQRRDERGGLPVLPAAGLGDPGARPGDRVRPGEELALVQLPHRAAPVCERPALAPAARAWVDAVHRATTVVGGPPR